jgi:single-strand DNA-binding protein
MANEPLITVTGRVGNDPDLRFSSEGKAVLNFSLASTPSQKTATGWEEKETMWFKVGLWKNAEAVCEALNKGQLVVVTGRLSIKSYVNKAGETKTEMVIDADGMGITPTQPKATQPKQDEPGW